MKKVFIILIVLSLASIANSSVMAKGIGKCEMYCVNNIVAFPGTVGIGSATSPGYTLDVSGDINFTGTLY